MKRLLLILLLAPSAFAQIVKSTPQGLVVARPRSVELEGAWRVRGVEHATAVIVGEGRVAVLDALNNEAIVVSLADGKTTPFRTGETPIDAVFLGPELYVLCRDAQRVQSFPGGRTFDTDPDPAFLRASGGRVFVYSRAAGTVAQLGGASVAIGPFASDFEIAGDSGYLVYPREARVRTLDLRTMKKSGEVQAGAVPVDLAFAGGGTALTARLLAIADPSAKRVWLTESSQSVAQAVARGFLRGLLGLGLFGSRASQFPTGVDRVLISGRTWLAYDSSSGTLYQFTKSSSRILATGLAPQAFAVTPAGPVFRR